MVKLLTPGLCYTTTVQNSFYASGFIYSLNTNQIFLLKTQQKSSTDFLWSTIRGESQQKEESIATFQRIINELLGLNIKTKNIYPVYDYFHDTWNKDNYVFYAEIRSPKKFNRLKEDSFAWVGFEEISKLLFIANSKQDVIVGHRVIDAKRRDDEASKIQAISDILTREASFGIAK